MTETPKKKKRRHGPEPKPASEQRRHRVGIYFSDAELARLHQLAFPNGTEGLTDQAISRGLSRYLRDVALGTLPPSIPTINQQAWAELARANANLNQAMRLANESGHTDLEATAAAVNQAVRQFRAGLVGMGGDAHEG